MDSATMESTCALLNPWAVEGARNRKAMKNIKKEDLRIGRNAFITDKISFIVQQFKNNRSIKKIRIHDFCVKKQNHGPRPESVDKQQLQTEKPNGNLQSGSKKITSEIQFLLFFTLFYCIYSCST